MGFGNTMKKRQRVQADELMIKRGCRSFVFKGMVFNKVHNTYDGWYKGIKEVYYYATDDRVYEIDIAFDDDYDDDYDHGYDEVVFCGNVRFIANTRYYYCENEGIFGDDDLDRVLNGFWDSFTEDACEMARYEYPETIAYKGGELKYEGCEYEGEVFTVSYITHIEDMYGPRDEYVYISCEDNDFNTYVIEAGYYGEMKAYGELRDVVEVIVLAANKYLKPEYDEDDDIDESTRKSFSDMVDRNRAKMRKSDEYTFTEASFIDDIDEALEYDKGWDKYEYNGVIRYTYHGGFGRIELYVNLDDVCYGGVGHYELDVELYKGEDEHREGEFRTVEDLMIMVYGIISKYNDGHDYRHWDGDYR